MGRRVRTGGLTAFGAFALALGCEVGWGTFTMPATTFLPTAGPLGTMLALVIGAALMCLAAVNTCTLASKEDPRGIYGIVYDSLGANHAFICGWCLVLVYISLIPLNASALTVVARLVAGDLLQSGPSWRVLGYEVALGESLVSFAAMATVAYAAMRGVRIEQAPQTVLACVLVAAVCAVAVAALIGGQLDPQHLAPAFSPSVAPMVGVLKNLTVVPWAFVGFEALTFWSDALGFPVRQLWRPMLAAVVAGAALYCALAVLSASGTPAGYEGWPAYLGALTDSELESGAPAVLAGAQAFGGRPIGIALMLAAAVAAILTAIIGFFAASVRLICVLAEARALPHQLCERGGRYGAPSKCCLFVLVASVFLLLMGRNALGWIVKMSSVGAAITYGYISVALMRRYPVRNNGLRFAGGLVGFALSALLLFLLLVPVPAFDCSLSFESYVCLITWVALGINFYTPKTVRVMAE